MAGDRTRHMDPGEFRRLGYLQEINRSFLHPLGLALAINVEDDGTETLDAIWDARDDPEGFTFDGFAEDSADKAAYIVDECAKRAKARERLFGTIIQPITGPENQP